MTARTIRGVAMTLATVIATASPGLAQELTFGRLAENALAFLYNTRKVEFAVCLYGQQTSQAVHVDRVGFTFLRSYSESSVTAEDCSPAGELLGMAHSHPNGDCRFSKADVVAFLDRQGHPFDFVMCAKNQVNWMNREEGEQMLRPARSDASVMEPQPPTTGAGAALSRLADAIVASLHITTGEAVAYLGSGGRLFAVPMAAATGSGTVTIVDVDEENLATVRQLANTANLRNISTRNVSAGGPPLGKPVQVVTLVDTWEHLRDAPQYFRALGAMLSANGRLGIIDLFAPFRTSPYADVQTPARVAGFTRVEHKRVGEAALLIFFK